VTQREVEAVVGIEWKESGLGCAGIDNSEMAWMMYLEGIHQRPSHSVSKEHFSRVYRTLKLALCEHSVETRVIRMEEEAVERGLR
jgi:hypothetical protein